jgi:hypothetical protein
MASGIAFNRLHFLVKFKGGRGWTWEVESAERFGIFDWRLKEKEGFNTETSEGTELAERKGYPHPRCFWVKSAELIEKKRLEFLAVQKSAQGCEKKELECSGERGVARDGFPNRGAPHPRVFS